MLVANETMSWEINVPLRNVCPGIAVIVGFSLDCSPTGCPGSMDGSIVASGEQTRFQVEVPAGNRAST